MPIVEVQAALDTLRHEGTVVIQPDAVGYRSAFIGAVLRTLPGATIELNPPRVSLQPLPSADVDAPNLLGDLDREAVGTGRREQAALRRWLLRGSSRGTCALCGRAFPADMLVAAHIKRRSLCDDAERRDLANIAMLACKFGCDDLFELGYIAVDRNGKLQVATIDPSADGAVKDHLLLLRDRQCSAHHAGSEPYFAWHRLNVFRAARRSPAFRRRTPHG